MHKKITTFLTIVHYFGISGFVLFCIIVNKYLEIAGIAFSSSVLQLSMLLVNEYDICNDFMRFMLAIISISLTTAINEFIKMQRSAEIVYRVFLCSISAFLITILLAMAIYNIILPHLTKKTSYIGHQTYAVAMILMMIYVKDGFLLNMYYTVYFANFIAIVLGNIVNMD